MTESEQKPLETRNEQGGIINVKIENNNCDRAEECGIKKPSSETSAGECRRSKYAKKLSWERATYCKLVAEMVEPERESEEELSNLADIVPGLVGMHKSVQSHFGSGFKRAYSSKAIEKHGVKIMGEIFSVEVSNDKPVGEKMAAASAGSKENNEQAPEGHTKEMIGHQPMAAEYSRKDTDVISGHSAGSISEDDESGYEESTTFRSIMSSLFVIPETDSFTPATGCRDASDFIVRCFVTRLRSGITVIKHARSRWCSSQLRIILVHDDGRSLTWKPTDDENRHRKKRATPNRLDLRSCLEVRHAWTPDPLSSSFTGTVVLRNKCEPENAHKSFSLIFPERTVDLTAITADQCRVLMEGFSALIYRLQVATKGGKCSLSDIFFTEDKASDTETMTNKTGPRSMQGMDD